MIDSVRFGRLSLERLADEAKRDRDEIAGRARNGMAQAKRRGVKLGNTTNLDVAQRNGAISNSIRSDRKVQELADFFEHTPGREKMTLTEKVELLNRSGPHNLISEKRDERRPWTMSSIRKPLKKAEAELEMRRELEDEEIVITPHRAWASLQDEKSGAQVSDAENTSPAEDDLPTSIAYKDHLGFGRF